MLRTDGRLAVALVKAANRISFGEIFSREYFLKNLLAITGGGFICWLKI